MLVLNILHLFYVFTVRIHITIHSLTLDSLHPFYQEGVINRDSTHCKSISTAFIFFIYFNFLLCVFNIYRFINFYYYCWLLWEQCQQVESLGFILEQRVSLFITLFNCCPSLIKLREIVRRSCTNFIIPQFNGVLEQLFILLLQILFINPVKQLLIMQLLTQSWDGQARVKFPRFFPSNKSLCYMCFSFNSSFYFFVKACSRCMRLLN